MGDHTEISWNALSPDTVGTGIAIPNRARHVLLALILHANRAVTTDQLVDALWGDGELPKSPRNTVARFVADLRASLGTFADRVTTVPGGYQLVAHPGERDLDIVAELTAQLAANPDSANVDELRAIITRVGTRANPVLDALHGHEATQRAHRELRIGLLEALAEALYRRSEHVELAALVEQIIDEHPYHERFWHLLMLSLHATGRPRDALHAYQRAASGLDELGATPTEPLQRTKADIEDSAAATYLPEYLPELPHPDTSLIGRVDDLRTTHAALHEHRAITILGLGGTGKTRLALGLAQAMQTADTPIFWVSVRDIDDSQLVVPLVAAALGMPSPAELDVVSLAQHAPRQPFLLVLDNCEHVREICRDLVTAFTQHAEQALVIATSREALCTPNEHTYLLAPLAVPPAVTLFIDRARLDVAQLAAGELGAGELGAIERICRRTNGLPLAIEIAAAQLAFMPLAELDERLARASTDTTINEPAHTAVTDMLDWAWNRLSPSQQALLARVSIFASGFTQAAATAVRAAPGNISADLERLVATGLINGPGQARPGVGGRYSLLPPVRRYASDQLAARSETTIMADRLAQWALDLTATYSFPQHHLWSEPNDQLHPEHGNLQAALAHLDAQKRTSDVVTLAVAASGMMVNRGLASDVIRWLSPYLDDTTLDDELRGSAHVAMGAAKHATGDLDSLTALGSNGIKLADGEPYDWLPTLAGYNSVWSLVAPTELTTDELSDIAQRAADNSATRELNQGVAALYRAHIEFVSRNYDEALALFRRAHILVEHPGRGLLVIELGMSLSLYMLGRHDEALASIDSWKSSHDTDHWHYILVVIKAIITGGTGDPHTATTELTEIVRALPEAGAWGRAGIIQTAFAMLADFRGEPELATELFASAANRDILLLSVAIAHVMQVRGVSGDEAWLETGIEFWTRIVPDDSVLATATSRPQLLRWWSTGEV